MSLRRRILDNELYAHFVTFSCDRRRRALEEDQPQRVPLGVLNQRLGRQDATCVGFVVMPEHVHAVVWFPKPKQLSLFMHECKRISREKISAWFRQHRPKYYAAAEMAGQSWQPQYYPFEIDTQKKLREKVDCMHKNPLERELVTRAVDYHWSSARWWLEGRPVGVPLGWIE
jgi:putative transposase